MSQVVRPSLRDETRRQRLSAIKMEQLKECHDDTLGFFQNLRHLEHKMSYFLTEMLPSGIASYGGILESCLQQAKGHGHRLAYWLYLRGNTFGQCTSCQKDIPLPLLNPKRGLTTCSTCPPNEIPTIFQ